MSAFLRKIYVDFSQIFCHNAYSLLNLQRQILKTSFMSNKNNYSSVMCPKDTGRLIRSIESTLQKCELAIQRMQNAPRWTPDPDLVKKYNLIEFL